MQPSGLHQLPGIASHPLGFYMEYIIVFVICGTQALGSKLLTTAMWSDSPDTSFPFQPSHVQKMTKVTLD